MKKILAAPLVRRLPSYLTIIRSAREEGETYISGTFIARELGMEAIQVRKDLSITGILGKPKAGYHIESLIDAIECFLGWDMLRDAALVGVGNLGSALLGYRDFNLHGIHFVAAFDNNPKKIGTTIHGIRIMSSRTMDIQIRNLGIKIAILTVPSPSAQEAADMLVASGVEGLWNFTGVKLTVPDTVVVHNEDLSSGFAMLCVKMHNNKKTIAAGQR